ncbi:MAG: hypothetical protein ACHQKY_17105 [Terriglobia bacterium]
MKLRHAFLFISCLFCLATLVFAQEDLGEAARKERERQAAVKQKSRVFTNQDVVTRRPAEETPPPSAEVKKPASEEEPLDSAGHNEKYWSQKFIAAKKLVADAEQRQKDLEVQIRDYSYRLLNQTDVYDREHLYGPLIDQANKDLAKNKQDQEEAKAALDDLYKELGKSGAPREWADSTLATQEVPPEHPTLEYYQKQLKKLDDEYQAMERSYKVQRFQLINRRLPTEQDSLDAKDQNYGLGADPSIPQLDAKINEIEQKHQEARDDLIRKAGAAGFSIP